MRLWSIIARKYGKAAGEWNLGRSVVALLVSLKLPNKCTKNLIISRLISWSLAEVVTVLPKGLSQNNLLFLLPLYKIHLQLLLLGFCGSFVMFSNGKRENFEFLV